MDIPYDVAAGALVASDVLRVFHISEIRGARFPLKTAPRTLM
jgi:hypothetical protein